MKKVSVILPVYNVEQYLAKSIESVLKQTYANFELIIVIDGSKDNSEAIANEFAQKDSRIKVYLKPNGGLSDARNYGLNVATGEYIYFLDSDDWIEPNLLEENLNILLKKEADFIIFGFYQDNVNQDEKIIQQIKHIPTCDNWIKGDDLILTPYMLNILGYAWNKMYKKKYLDQYLLSFAKGISLVEDILFNAQVYQNSSKIIFNQKTYVHYIQRPVTTLTKQFHEKSFEWVKLKHLALSDFVNIWSFKNKNTILAENLVGGLRYCVLNLFRFKNQYSYTEKVNYIKKMLNDPELMRYVQFYQPVTLHDKIYYQLIKYRATHAIALMAQLRG